MHASTYKSVIIKRIRNDRCAICYYFSESLIKTHLSFRDIGPVVPKEVEPFSNDPFRSDGKKAAEIADIPVVDTKTG